MKSSRAFRVVPHRFHHFRGIPGITFTFVFKSNSRFHNFKRFFGEFYPHPCSQSVQMKIQNVKNCSFSSWYDMMRRETFKSEIIPLPKEVVDYLLADGIVLPKSAGNGQYRQRASAELSSDSDDGVGWDEDSMNAEENAPSFPEFEEKVTNAIQRLGGRVFPKLNWSAPRDAAWVAFNNSLECHNLGDIFLLLKSSDFSTRDITQPFVYCDDCSEAGDVDYELVLRRWTDIPQNGEFRCFVKNKNLIAICQRAQNVHFLCIERHQQQIVDDIIDFYHMKIEDKFTDDDFVFDVYRRDEDQIQLVDFNPYGECTDTLLFTWAELRSIASEFDHNSEPVFRHGENRGVQPGPFQAYALPRDVVDLCSGADVNKLIDVMRLHENVAGSSSEGEES